MRSGLNWGRLVMSYEKIFGKLPLHWKVEPLKKYADVIDPHPSHRAPPEVQSGYPFLGIGDLDYYGNATFSLARHVGIEVIEEQEKNYRIDYKTIGYAKMGNTIGKIVSFPRRGEPQRYAVSPALSIINPLDNINPFFLRAVIESTAFWGQVNGKITGSTRPSIGIQQLREVLIPVPPESEQEIIGAIWHTLFQKMLLNNRINENLEQQAQALFKSWFIDFEPYGRTIPQDWHFGTASEVIEFHDSKRIPLSSRERAQLDKVYPYYGATSIMDYVDRYLFDGIYLLLGEDGTVVDAKGFPILQYVEGKFWVNNHAHILTGKKGFSVELLYLLFKSTNVASIVTGAVQPKISQANLNKVPVVVPSEKELLALDAIIQPLFSQIRILRAENDRLSSVRDALLPKLMSGELDVSNIDI